LVFGKFDQIQSINSFEFANVERRQIKAKTQSSDRNLQIAVANLESRCR